MKNIKEKKPFSMVNMIVTEMIILYIVIRIGDMIDIIGNLPDIVSRYIPVGIATVIFTNFLIRSGAKKVSIFEKEDFLKKIKIIPIIVAIILLIYGIISVNNNISKMEDKISQYRTLYSNMNKDASNEFDKMIEDAKNKAIMSWVLTSIIYLALSEGTTFAIKDKIDDLFNEDESNQIYETKNEYPAENNMGSNNEETLKNTDDTNDAVKKIKWDL